MFHDSAAWPPSPDGNDPPPRRVRKLNAHQEGTLMKIAGLLILLTFLGPFAGSSVLSALVALTKPLLS